MRRTTSKAGPQVVGRRTSVALSHRDRLNHASYPQRAAAPCWCAAAERLFSPAVRLMCTTWTLLASAVLDTAASASGQVLGQVLTTATPNPSEEAEDPATVSGSYNATAGSSSRYLTRSPGPRAWRRLRPSLRVRLRTARASCFRRQVLRLAGPCSCLPAECWLRDGALSRPMGRGQLRGERRPCRNHRNQHDGDARGQPDPPGSCCTDERRLTAGAFALLVTACARGLGGWSGNTGSDPRRGLSLSSSSEPAPAGAR